MVIFNDANQARLSLKMQLSRYSWYKGSFVEEGEGGDFAVVIMVEHKDDVVKRTVPVVHNGVDIRTDIVRGAR
jgi:hypothetical protein